MRGSSPDERGSALALAGALGVLIAARFVGPLGRILTVTLSAPADAAAAVLPMLLAGAVAGCTALAARLVLVLVRRTLRSRVRINLLPSEAFDP